MRRQQYVEQQKWDAQFVVTTDEFLRAYASLMRELRIKCVSNATVARRLHINEANIYRWQTRAPKMVLVRRAVLGTLNKILTEASK